MSTFPCRVCGKVFRRSGKLTQHQRTHTGDRPWICSESDHDDAASGCGRAFARRDNLERHRATCPVASPLPIPTTPTTEACADCGRRFSRKQHLVRHVRQQRCRRSLPAPPSSSGFFCAVDGCESPPFEDVAGLQQHVAQAHHERRRHHCPDCGLGFEKPSRLTAHRRVHEQPLEDRQGVPCNECSKRFTTAWNRKVHIDTVHRRLKQFQCRVCLAQFGLKQSLARHLARTHSAG
mmetsp:Transcript_15508/g.31362  ORF Transcript_15508/g.31362 Transcript_15508/m.31362 type:complete len:235 (+) Transcript_15508:4036-4740(+)